MVRFVDCYFRWLQINILGNGVPTYNTDLCISL
jgi:hypothetical protein